MTKPINFVNVAEEAWHKVNAAGYERQRKKVEAPPREEEIFGSDSYHDVEGNLPHVSPT